MKNAGNCLNCNFEIAGDFCSSCGQSSSVGRITIKETMDHFLSSAFSFEGPLLLTIRQLIVNPGIVCREFIAGRRRAYYKPVAFFVLMSALYIIIRALIGFDPLEGVLDNELALSSNMRIKRIAVASRFMVDNINNIMFFLVLSMALVLKMFYPRRYYLAEYASVGFYISGMYILLGILFMLISQYIVRYNNGFQLFFLLGYIVFCLYSWFIPKSKWLVFKYLLMSVFIIILYTIFGFGFSYSWVTIFNVT